MAQLTTNKRKRIVLDPIHNYFSYDEANKTSKCNIDNCDHNLRGKNPHNMKRHVKALHKEIFLEYSEQVVKKKLIKLSKSEISVEENIAEIERSERKYDDKDEIQLKFNKNLVSLAATSSIPLYLVEKIEFKKLIYDIDPKINIPGRKNLVKRVLAEFYETQQTIRNLLGNTYGISIGSDIWSKKGLSESYIAVNAYFINCLDNKKYVLCLVLKNSLTHIRLLQ